MNESEIQVLMSELDQLKSEVKDLRMKLHAVDRKKEDLFREKRKVSSDIYSRIRGAQESKQKRNDLTDVVKTTKHSREELEQRITTLDDEINKLKEEKKRLLEKVGVDDPMMLKKEIKRIEFKIETAGLTFDKEKELMKVLSKMKKQYESTHAVADVEKKLSHAFREIRDYREQLDMTKKIVQHSAKESQKHHVELVESSKEIDDLKKRESEFEEKIGAFKTELNGYNDEISKRSARMDEIRKVLTDNHVKLKEDQERSHHEILKQKDQEVQEKIKKGKKLTTEDLLVLQRTMK